MLDYLSFQAARHEMDTVCWECWRKDAPVYVGEISPFAGMYCFECLLKAENVQKVEPCW